MGSFFFQKHSPSVGYNRYGTLVDNVPPGIKSEKLDVNGGNNFYKIYVSGLIRRKLSF
jgi:hypothetical protein